MKRPYSIDAQKRQQFAGIVVLNSLVDSEGGMPLLLEDNDQHLEPILDWLHNRGHLEITDNQHYRVSASGREAVERYRAQYVEFLLTFDIYSSIDLEEGVFAFERIFDFEHESDWEEYMSRDCWDDLRIPIAELKGLNPPELVFLSFVNEGYFIDTENWQLALVEGALWDEIETICNAATTIDELGFDDPEDGRIEGREFLEGIIREGADLNLELKKAELEAEDEEEDGEEFDEDDITVEYYEPYYDPYYISPVWMAVWLL